MGSQPALNKKLCLEGAQAESTSVTLSKLANNPPHRTNLNIIMGDKVVERGQIQQLHGHCTIIYRPKHNKLTSGARLLKKQAMVRRLPDYEKFFSLPY